MFYQEALPKFRLLSRVNSLLAIGDGNWRKVATTFEKAESASLLQFAVPVHVGAYFCMGVYKHNVVVVIKMGAYIHGVLILCGCLLSQFYGIGEEKLTHPHFIYVAVPGRNWHYSVQALYHRTSIKGRAHTCYVN